ncbi:hypothetical protein K474DRAFT_1517587 [Panus rudis PR-1116 ss-1]|nr:hypothetical protein K474DRAFT_1517587 [Panus rudis PR-1116 ss-1]
MRVTRGPVPLPLETYEEIIKWVDNLDPTDRQKALCACALTCSAWLYRSQACLFKELRIEQEPGDKDLTPIWEGAVEALRTKPFLRRHVRTLHITLLEPTDALRMLAPLLPNLQRLFTGYSIHDYNIMMQEPQISESVFLSAVSMFSSVHSLIIDHLCYGTYGLAPIQLKMLEVLPSITTFSIYRQDVDPMSQDETWLDTTRLGFRLHTLRLHQDSLDDNTTLIGLFLAVPTTVSSLQRLYVTLDPTVDGTSTDLENLLECCGSNLTDLVLHLKPDADTLMAVGPTGFDPLPDLESNTNLRRIHIYNIALNQFLIAGLLESLAYISPTIEELHLTLENSNAENAPKWDAQSFLLWQELDDILDESEFRSLRLVTISVVRDDSTEQDNEATVNVQNSVPPILPKLYARGVLHFGSPTDSIWTNLVCSWQLWPYPVPWM